MEDAEEVKKKWRRSMEERGQNSATQMDNQPIPHAGFYRQRRNYYPALLPLPLQLPPPTTPPPPLPPPFLHLLTQFHHPLAPTHLMNTSPPFSKTFLRGEDCKPQSSSFVTHSVLPYEMDALKLTKPSKMAAPSFDCNITGTEEPQVKVAATARRPDPGGHEGLVIPLLANHFPVQFDPSQEIFHYDVDIFPRTTKETARLIKKKLVHDNSDALSGATPVYDGRRNLYSSIEFQDDRIEFFVSLPISTTPESVLSADRSEKEKVFRVSVRLVSKISSKDLNKFIADHQSEERVPVPQDYLHALDVVLRETAIENGVPVGRCIYSSSVDAVKDLGGGAVGLRGFFQSLRPTQNGLTLNVDFTVMAFHESIGIIPYLQKRFNFLQNLSRREMHGLVGAEKKEVEKALKNIRIFVCHRRTYQRYRVFSLTDEPAENLKFSDGDGKDVMLVDYFKEHYNHELEFPKLPCLQISRSKPCYLPMELCVICEGQKFLGKLSNEQTARIIKMGSQSPRKRKEIINSIVGGPASPSSGRYASEFNLSVSKEMTQFNGRVLKPPKLKFGEGGTIKDLIPDSHDRQWNILDSHVTEGSHIKRWTIISFGGTLEQRSSVPRFVNQLSLRCYNLGIFLNKKTVISPAFEQIHVLNNVSLLEHKLRKIYEVAFNNLQLLVCVMEKRHKGYADIKRIAETSIGMVTQCCLFSNICKLSSQFLSNLALKINAKLGGCNVELYNNLVCQIPRIFAANEPTMFMGADVTHPHPLDDSSPSVSAVVASMDWPAANKYVSKMRSQTHRKEIIEDLADMVFELLEDFRDTSANRDLLPCRVIFFRDGVSETQFHKVLSEELKSIRAACGRFSSGYDPSITFVVVQKRHHTRLFVKETDGNIPAGTVVDTVITHPREFDFYLCSHWGTRGTSRPAHYHVLWDENKFTSDEIQKLIHSLCYTFAKSMKPISIVPPAYYAHLAAYRGRLYLERPSELQTSSSSSSNRSRITVSRSGCGNTCPLPKPCNSVKKLMFYC